MCTIVADWRYFSPEVQSKRNYSNQSLFEINACETSSSKDSLATLKRNLKLHLNWSHQTELRESSQDLKPLMFYKEQMEEISFSWMTFLDIQHLMSGRHNKVEDTFSASPAFTCASTHKYALISKLWQHWNAFNEKKHLNTISETYSNVSNWSGSLSGHNISNYMFLN